MRSTAGRGKFTKLHSDESDDEIELAVGNGSRRDDWQNKSSNGAALTGSVSHERDDSFQHVDNVLEQSYITAQRNQDWRDDWVSFLARTPSPLFNWVSIGCSAAALFFGIMLLLGNDCTTPSYSDGYTPPACPLAPPCTCPIVNCTQCTPTDGSTDVGAGTTQQQGDSITAAERPDGLHVGRHVDWEGYPRVASGTRGVVAADHGRCSRLALSILQSGGNAVDAAVTLCLCQGLMNPGASGIGGGHFAVVRTPDGHTEVINAREMAPAAANETMFVDRPEAALEGGLAMGVPLELQGLYSAHQRHGALLWKQVVHPVVSIARDGFATHPYLAQQLNSSYAKLMRHPEARDAFLLQDVEGNWRAPLVNETCCVRPTLATFLEDVAVYGPNVLYNGKYSGDFIQDIQSAGGIITEDDLANANALIEEPITAEVLGMQVYLPPPPSSSVVLIPALNVLARYPLPLTAAGLLQWHRIVEAMKHSYAIRLHLGDPGVPQGGNRRLTEVLHAAKTTGDNVQAVLHAANILLHPHGKPSRQLQQYQDDPGQDEQDSDTQEQDAGVQQEESASVQAAVLTSNVEGQDQAQGEGEDSGTQGDYMVISSAVHDSSSSVVDEDVQEDSEQQQQQQVTEPKDSQQSSSEDENADGQSSEAVNAQDFQQLEPDLKAKESSEQDEEASNSEGQESEENAEVKDNQGQESEAQDTQEAEKAQGQESTTQGSQLEKSQGQSESKDSLQVDSENKPPPAEQETGQASPFGLDLTELLKTIVTKEFADELRALISDTSVSDYAVYGGPFGAYDFEGPPPDDHGTSHMSIVDVHGNAVAITSTINTAFGSGVMSKATGILLNNQMDDFSNPGKHNVYGLPPSKANFIRPGKRPLSSMSPMLLVQNGELRAALGASGGPLILSAVLQTVVRTMLLAEDPFEAVAGARVHDQLTNMTYLEDWSAGNTVFKLPQSVSTALEDRGHSVSSGPFGAIVQLVLRNPDDETLTGVSDPRKDGSPAAY